jgi:hypothetical protein
LARACSISSATLLTGSVGRDTRYIGVSAIGATARDVRRLVAGQALVPVSIGAFLGLLGAMAAGKGMGGLLFQVEGYGSDDGEDAAVAPRSSGVPGRVGSQAMTLLTQAIRAADPAERLALCVQALEYGRVAPALLATASACMEVNDLDAAARDLDEALDRAPDWAAAHFEQLSACRTLRRPGQILAPRSGSWIVPKKRSRRSIRPFAAIRPALKP